MVSRSYIIASFFILCSQQINANHYNIIATGLPLYFTLSIFIMNLFI